MNELQDTLQVHKPKQFKIETPIGSVESDSGNHAIDVLSVVVIVATFFVIKKIIKRWS